MEPKDCPPRYLIIIIFSSEEVFGQDFEALMLLASVDDPHR